MSSMETPEATEPTLDAALENLFFLGQLDHLHLHLTQLDDVLLGEPTVPEITEIITYSPLRDALRTLLAEHPDMVEPKRLLPLLKDLRKAAESRKLVRITLPCKFEDADLKEIISELSLRVNAPVILDVTIDTSIIGGAIIEYGSFSNDYSIKTRLEQLKSTWNRAVTSEDHA